MNKIKLVAVLILLAVGSAFAYRVEIFESFPIYPDGSAESSGIQAPLFLRRLVSRGPAEIRNFVARAEVSLKMESRDVVADIQALSWSAPPASALKDGWTRRGSEFVWLPRNSARALRIPFNVSRGSSSLSGKDKLRIRYQDVFPGSRTAVNVLLMMRGRKRNGRPVTIAAATTDLKSMFPLKTVDVAAASLAPKDYSYVLRRSLGWGPGADWRTWRYIRTSGDFWVLQRRFHQNLSRVGAIDIASEQGTKLLGINLYVSRENNYARGDLIEARNGIDLDSDARGMSVARFPVQDLVRECLGKSDSAGSSSYLQELIVLVSGDGGRIRCGSSNQKIIFEGWTHSETRAAGHRRGFEIVSLPELSIKNTQGWRTAAVDLRDPRFNGARLIKGFLILRPDNPLRPAGIDLKDIRLVGLWNEDVPVFQKDGETLSSRWGGPFLDADNAPSGFSEWPELAAYLPFKTFSNQGRQIPDDHFPVALIRRNGGAQLILHNMTAGRPHDSFWIKRPRPASSEGKKDFIVAQGVKIHSGGLILNVANENGGLTLNGIGGKFDIEWSVSSRIDKDARFYFGMADGAADIARATLEVLFASGKTLSLNFRPNQAIRIGRSGTLRRLRVHLWFSKDIYRARLTEMVVFTPRLLTAKKAFVEKCPVWRKEALAAAGVRGCPGCSVQSREGLLTAALPFNKEGQLDWTTPIDRPLHWVSGVRLNYQVPSRLAQKNPCWLDMDLHWRHHNLRRTLCFASASGRVDIPLGRFLGPKDDAAKFGTLESIAWRLHWPPLRGPAGFSLRAKVGGYALKSAQDELRNWRIASSHGVKLTPAPLSAKRAVEIVRNPVRRAFDAASLQEIILSGGNINPLDHPYFQLDSVAIEPVKTMPLPEWLKLTSRRGRERPLDIFRLVFWISLGLLLLAGGNKILTTVRGAAAFPLGLGRAAAAYIGRLPRGFFWSFDGFLGATSAILYWWGLRGNFSPQGNSALDFAGVFATLFFLGFLKLLEPSFSRFEKMSSAVRAVYRSWGSLCFSCALGLLVLTAITLSLRAPFLPEQLAIWVYYCLVLGVAAEIASLRGAREN